MAQLYIEDGLAMLLDCLLLNYNSHYIIGWHVALRLNSNSWLLCIFVLPNTGTRLVPEYFCLIPEQIVFKAEQIVYRFELLHSGLIALFWNISVLFWNRFEY